MAALNNPHGPSDIGTLTIGGIGLTCSFDDVTWSTNKTEVDVSGPCREGALNQTTGIQGTLQGNFFGGSNNGYVTNYLDFTGVQVGGVDIQPQLYSMNFAGGFEKAALPAATAGMAEGVIRRNFNGSLEMVLDDNETVQNLIVAAESMDFADAETYLLFTLLGRPIRLPIKLGNASHPITKSDYQKVTLNWTGQAPARGTAYPTLPASLPGSPGLLDWALLTPRQTLAFTFASKLVHGLVRTGTLSWGDFSFNYAQRDVTRFNYQFMTFGNFNTTISEA